jgi:hypothetical protein
MEPGEGVDLCLQILIWRHSLRGYIGLSPPKVRRIGRQKSREEGFTPRPKGYERSANRLRH